MLIFSLLSLIYSQSKLVLKVEQEDTAADAEAISPLYFLACSRVQPSVEKEQNCPVSTPVCLSGWRGVSGEEWGKGGLGSVYS